METREQCVNEFRVNNKDTRTMGFKQVNAGWNHFKRCQLLMRIHFFWKYLHLFLKYISYFIMKIIQFTVWKVSKYGVISGPYFPVFNPNTWKYGPEITPYLDTFHAEIHCSWRWKVKKTESEFPDYFIIIKYFWVLLQKLQV